LTASSSQLKIFGKISSICLLDEGNHRNWHNLDFFRKTLHSAGGGADYSAKPQIQQNVTSRFADLGHARLIPDSGRKFDGILRGVKLFGANN
jgi:hypothetical protein